jgi:hypothetical protein
MKTRGVVKDAAIDEVGEKIEYSVSRKDGDA